MKRLSLALFIALFALVLTNSAFANSVSLTFEYEHQNHYYFSINGSTNFSTMMCDSFDNHIHSGETWTATKSPFLAGIASGLFGSSMTLDYKAAGLIYKSMLTGSLTTLQAQWAIWGLFSNNAQHDHGFLTYGGAATDAVYLVARSDRSQQRIFRAVSLHSTPWQARLRPAGVYRLQPGSRARQLDTTRYRFDRTGWRCPPQVRQGVAFSFLVRFLSPSAAQLATVRLFLLRATTHSIV